MHEHQGTQIKEGALPEVRERRLGKGFEAFFAKTTSKTRAFNHRLDLPCYRLLPGNQSKDFPEHPRR